MGRDADQVGSLSGGKGSDLLGHVLANHDVGRYEESAAAKLRSRAEQVSLGCRNVCFPPGQLRVGGPALDVVVWLEDEQQRELGALESRQSRDSRKDLFGERRAIKRNNNFAEWFANPRIQVARRRFDNEHWNRRVPNERVRDAAEG